MLKKNEEYSIRDELLDAKAEETTKSQVSTPQIKERITEKSTFAMMVHLAQRNSSIFNPSLQVTPMSLISEGREKRFSSIGKGDSTLDSIGFNHLDSIQFNTEDNKSDVKAVVSPPTT